MPSIKSSIYRVRALSLFTFFSLTNLLTPRFWIQEVFQNLGAYLLFLHLIVLIGTFYLKIEFGRYFKFILPIQIICIIYYIAFLWSFFFGAPLYYDSELVDSSHYENSSLNQIETDKGLNQQKLGVLFANVYTANTQYQDLKKTISNYKPDLIGLVEINREWIRELNLSGEYPYHFEIPREDNFGIAIYSKYPFNEEAQSNFGEDIAPAIFSVVRLPNNKNLNITVLHCMPPLSQDALYHNRLLLRRVASKVRFTEDPTIIMGDLNATPYSSYYKRIVNWANLRNAFWGAGLIRTWNVWNPLIRLQLDHIFIKGSINVKKSQVLDAFGSDHLPLYVELNIS